VSNLAPRSVKRLTDAALRGDFAAARAEHGVLHALAKALLSLDTNPVPIKAALAVRGWCTDEVRLPLCGLSEENRRKLVVLLGQSALD
jgi:4-hydroxy-tetrahydrodipicolinate synthase